MSQDTRLQLTRRVFSTVSSALEFLSVHIVGRGPMCFNIVLHAAAAECK